MPRTEWWVSEMADVRNLPVPVAEVWDWQLRAACRNLESGLFFHPERERGPSRAQRESRAKAVCRTCPVLAQCRAHALAAREQFGVWGGLSAAERVEIAGGARPGRVVWPSSRR